MASQSSTPTMNPEIFSKYVEKGRTLTEYLFYDIEQLDKVNPPLTCQISPNWWSHHGHHWEGSCETGRANLVLETISDALCFLKVGSEGQELEHLKSRNIDARAMPRGPNIPMTLSSEVGQMVQLLLGKVG